MIRDKKMLALAKQSAEGIEQMYGRKTDWGLIQHHLREACTLERQDLPSSLKPKVTRERAMWLKKVLNASKGFDIPALVALLEMKTPAVFSVDMTHTAGELYKIQSSGGNQRPVASERRAQMKASQQARKHAGGPVTIEGQSRQRQLDIAPMFRALKCQRRVYGRTMGQVRDAFVNADKEGMGNLTRVHAKVIQNPDNMHEWDPTPPGAVAAAAGQHQPTERQRLPNGWPNMREVVGLFEAVSRSRPRWISSTTPWTTPSATSRAAWTCSCTRAT